MTPAASRAAVVAAIEAGYTLFDHADIYGEGRAETVFGQILTELPGAREGMLLASKCGIRRPGDPVAGAPYRYDFSAEHILRSCEESLRRLGVDHLDLYQLHRPDFLMDPAEVAGAFAKLREAGKVREFGVSNFKPSQVAALQRACPMRLVVNQVEISLANPACVEDGTLDHCLAERLTPLAWSPLGAGLLGAGARRLLPAQEAYAGRVGPIVEAVDALAAERGLPRAAVALGWLLRHPSGIIPLVGTTDPGRIREAARAEEAALSREDWYRLYEPARGQRLP
jgi:predicted oxidoreductase